MGFLKDIEDMPNQYEYSQEFFKRFYRPEYTTVVLVGDVTRERALELTKKYFGDWKRGDYVPKIPAEPTQTEPRTAHLTGLHRRCRSSRSRFAARLTRMRRKTRRRWTCWRQIAFGENSDLYQKLVLKEQKVDLLEAVLRQSGRPRTFHRLRARQGSEGRRLRARSDPRRPSNATQPNLIPQQKLDATRSRLRYSFALWR